jgi:hypothetical protein
MGTSLWLLGEVNFLLTVAVAGITYLAALVLVGGLTQHDMNVLWRAVPLDRLRARLGRLAGEASTE